MQARLAVALVLAALLVQPAFAMALDPQPVSVREQNRQVLIAQEGTDYLPTRATQVVVGAPDALTSASVTLAEAIELHLDYLDRHGIRLGESPPQQHAASAATDEPDWPLIGQIELTENGWKQSGASCPEVIPDWPPMIEAQFPGLPTGSDTVGSFITNISEAYESPSGALLTSTLEFWELNESVAGPPSGYWEYGGPRDEGWTLLVGVLIDELQVSLTEVFCREPAPGLATGRVSHHALVRPYVERLTELEDMQENG